MILWDEWLDMSKIYIFILFLLLVLYQKFLLYIPYHRLSKDTTILKPKCQNDVAFRKKTKI
jgi:hypothetical protein